MASPNVITWLLFEARFIRPSHSRFFGYKLYIGRWVGVRYQAKAYGDRPSFADQWIGLRRAYFCLANNGR